MDKKEQDQIMKEAATQAMNNGFERVAAQLSVVPNSRGRAAYHLATAIHYLSVALWAHCRNKPQFIRNSYVNEKMSRANEHLRYAIEEMGDD